MIIGLIIGGLMMGFVCGLIPFSVGKKRGHEDLAKKALLVCTLCGLGLGVVLALPVAIVFTVIIANRKSVARINYSQIAVGAQPTLSTGNKMCPKCAETIRLEAIVCRFCNYQFAGTEAVSAGFSSMGVNAHMPALASADNLGFCKNCGTKFQEASPFCNNCGVPR